MKHKTILALIAISLFAISCHIGAKTVTQETPDEPDEIKAERRNVPEGYLMGVGKAKEATDGESILLAQDYARTEIARQMDMRVQFLAGDDDEITRYFTNARLTGSVIQKLVRTNDGTWWCAVCFSAYKAAITPVILSEEDLAYYGNNSPDLAKIRAVKTIPDWVFNPAKIMPLDLIYGIGAAKGKNDKDALSLATERARRSVAHSLDSEIKSLTLISKTTQNSVEKEENYLSITSLYDDRTFDTIIINAAKTKDGTWWVLLGCNISKTYE